MGKTRGKYKPKEENIRKLFAFLTKEQQITSTEVNNKEKCQIQ